MENALASSWSMAQFEMRPMLRENNGVDADNLAGYSGNAIRNPAALRGGSSCSRIHRHSVTVPTAASGEVNVEQTA